MSIDQDLPSPDVDELQQREDNPLLVVPVRPVEPVPVHEVPARRAAAFTQTVTTTPDKVLAGPDPKRRRVLLFPSGVCYVATTANAGAGARIPANVPVELKHHEPVFIRAAADTVDVGVIVETWAD
jgi:hypothetical protein